MRRAKSLASPPASNHPGINELRRASEEHAFLAAHTIRGIQFTYKTAMALKCLKS